MITRRMAFALAVHCLSAGYLALGVVAFPRGVDMPPLFIDPHMHLALAAGWMYGVLAIALAVTAQLASLMPTAFRKFRPGDADALHFASTQCLAFAFVALWVASRQS